MSKTDPLNTIPNDFKPQAEDLYDIFGVEPTASTEEINRAYKQMLKEYHPDTSDHPDAEDISFALNNAQNIIGDSNERLLYEQLGHEEYFNQASGASNEYDHSKSKTNEEPSIYELVQMTNFQSHIQPNEPLLLTIVRSTGFKVFIGAGLFLTTVFVILLFT